MHSRLIAGKRTMTSANAASLESDRIYHDDYKNLMDFIPDGSVDLVICDGPYKKTAFDWDKVGSIQQYNLELIRAFSQKLKDGGALYLFGKPDCIDFIDYRPFLKLRSRIIWYQPSSLAQGRINYTNNYDVICYFTKNGKVNHFNLEDIRIEQLTELTQRLRCENVPSVKNGKFGKTSFNKKGKNPGDVWGDIKQLTYKSKELIAKDYLNTIQKPVKLYERIIKASSSPNDLVLDCFAGTGTTAIACKMLNRRFICIEKDKALFGAAQKRITDFDKQSQRLLSTNFR